jgi:hypothetical protein
MRTLTTADTRDIVCADDLTVLLEEDLGGRKIDRVADDSRQAGVAVSGSGWGGPSRPIRRIEMTISRKLLLRFAALVVVLFLIALPLGDAHHGLGAHHKLAADLGNGIWAAFLISAAVLVVLALVAALQLAIRSRRARVVAPKGNLS